VGQPHKTSAHNSPQTTAKLAQKKFGVAQVRLAIARWTAGQLARFSPAHVFVLSATCFVANLFCGFLDRAWVAGALPLFRRLSC
jgi:hypothetical protein